MLWWCSVKYLLGIYKTFFCLLSYPVNANHVYNMYTTRPTSATLFQHCINVIQMFTNVIRLNVIQIFYWVGPYSMYDTVCYNNRTVSPAGQWFLSVDSFHYAEINYSRWGSARYSDRSIFRQVVIPTGLYSDSSIFRQVVIPTGLYSDRSIFRQLDIPTGRYSDRSIFRQVYIPTSRYSDRSLFRQFLDVNCNGN